MVYSPRTEETLWEEEVLPQLDGRSPGFTHTVSGTPNHMLSREVFTRQLAIFSQVLLYVYFAGHLPYAGKQITEEDCRDVGIDPDRVNLSMLNGWQSDVDLEAQAAQNSVTRDPGAYATGEVRFTVTEAGAAVPANVTVTTPQSNTGERLSYHTTERVEAGDNATTVLAPVQADERGPSHNTGTDTLTNLPSPPSRVQDVENPEPISGGEPEESNAELRERAMSALSRQSGGGTEWGIEGSVVEALDGVGGDDVVTEAHRDGQPTRPETDGAPYGVVVIDYDGPTDDLETPDGDPVDSLQGLVQSLAPFGFGVFYESPDTLTLDATIEVAPPEPEQTQATPADIDSNRVQEAFVQHVSTLGLGDDIYEAQLEQATLNADRDIAYAPTFDLTLVAPDDSTTAVSDRHAIAPRETVEAGDITVTAVENPSTGS